MLVVGDGIREEMESLTDYLQVHAGLHFTFALVEMAIHELPDALGFLVQPRVLARTVNIDRGIVRVERDRIIIKPPDRPTGTTLTEEMFYEQLEAQDSALPGELKRFLSKLEPLGVRIEMGKSLMLKWPAIDATEFNLGYVKTNGDTWTDAVNWKASDLGLIELSHEYVSQVAEGIGGTVRRASDKNWWVVKNGKVPKIGDLVKGQEAWIAAIESFQTRVNTSLRNREP